MNTSQTSYADLVSFNHRADALRDIDIHYEAWDEMVKAYGADHLYAQQTRADLNGCIYRNRKVLA